MNSLKEDLSSLQEEVSSGKIHKGRYKYSGLYRYTNGDISYVIKYTLCEGKPFPSRSCIVSWTPVATSQYTENPIFLSPKYFSNGGTLDFCISYDDYQMLSSLDTSQVLRQVQEYIDVYYTDTIIPYD